MCLGLVFDQRNQVFAMKAKNELSGTKNPQMPALQRACFFRKFLRKKGRRVWSQVGKGQVMSGCALCSVTGHPGNPLVAKSEMLSP